MGPDEQVDRDLPLYTYRVKLDDPGPIAWQYEGGPKTSKKTWEPDVSVGRAFAADFFRLLPLEDQL